MSCSKVRRVFNAVAPFVACERKDARYFATAPEPPKSLAGIVAGDRDACAARYSCGDRIVARAVSDIGRRNKSN